MDEAERCTGIAFMDQGRVLFLDTPAGIKGRIAGELVEVTVDDYHAAAEVLRALPFVTSVEVYGDTLQVLVECAADCAGRISKALAAAGTPARSLRQGHVTMEVAFSELERGAGRRT